MYDMNLLCDEDQESDRDDRDSSDDDGDLGDAEDEDLQTSTISSPKQLFLSFLYLTVLCGGRLKLWLRQLHGHIRLRSIHWGIIVRHYLSK